MVGVGERVNFLEAQAKVQIINESSYKRKNEEEEHKDEHNKKSEDPATLEQQNDRM